MHQMLLGLIVSQSTHSIIRGVGLVTASLSLVRSLDHEQASYIRLRGQVKLIRCTDNGDRLPGVSVVRCDRPQPTRTSWRSGASH